MVTVYALPSVAALALKILIFWYGRHSFKVASIWLWAFFIGLFGMNLIELVGFYYVEQPEKGIIWLTGYYISAILAFSALLALSLDNVDKLTYTLKIIIAVVFTAGVISLLIPGAALAGAKSIGYSVTRIAGPYYFVVQLSILLPLMSFLGCTAFFSFKATDHSARRKSQILLLSCIPIFVAVILIMIIMQMGLMVNASVILSFMITLTLLILVYTEHKERQYKFMSLIPNTKESYFVKKLSKIITDPTIGLDQGRELIENEMIREALVISGGNKIQAASVLGVSRQTLSRKLEKYNKN